MFNKKVLAVAIAAATTVGSIAQLSAMELNEKGVGQALIGPIYYAQGSYKTNLTVVNTRTDAAVKVKVVLRSHEDSVEVLDFILYLSPADVWRGTVEPTGTLGEARIVSSDDSMRIGDDANGIGGKGGDEATISQVLNTASTGNLYRTGDSNDWGHVDVLGVYAIPSDSYTMSKARDYAGTGTATNAVTVVRGMKKNALAALFDDIDDSAVDTRNTDFNKCTVEALKVAGTAAAGVYSEVSSISPCALEITGSVEVTDGSTHRATYTMHAMNAGNPALPKIADGFFMNDGTVPGTGVGPAGVTEATLGAATGKPIVDAMLVVANANYNELRSANSHLAYNWGLSTPGGNSTGAAAVAGVNDSADGTRSNLPQYDAAIARTVTTWEYDAIADGTTNAVVSFPTRYMHRQYTNDDASASRVITFFNDTCGTTANPSTSKNEFYGQPFNTDGTVTRTSTTYDNSENSTTAPEGDFSGGAAGTSGKFTAEVNYIAHTNMGYFSESTGGWGHIRFTNSAGTCTDTRFGAAVSYTGFPALSLIYKIGGAGRLFEKTQDVN